MKCCNTYVLMAAMAISGVGMAAHAADDNITNGTNATAAQMQATGGQMADESTAKSARTTLAKVVNDAVEANKFSSVTGYLAKADRERLGTTNSDNNDALNKVIEQFRSDFKAKYNQEFDISNDTLKNAMVYAGQDKNSATVSVNRPQGSNSSAMNSTNANNMNSSTSTPSNGAMNSTSTGATADHSMSGAGNDASAKAGAAGANTDMAQANMNNAASDIHAMASAGMSGTTLNLVNEGHVMNAWRISAPQLSAEQLKSNLTKHIQMIDDQKAAWPSDVNQAYQAAAYHVLSAFSDNAVATER